MLRDIMHEVLWVQIQKAAREKYSLKPVMCKVCKGILSKC